MPNNQGPFHAIDEFLLNRTYFIASFVQRTFGLNNFDIARYFAVLLVVLEFSLALIAALYLRDNWKIFRGIVGAVVALMWHVYIRVCQSRCKPTFKNPERNNFGSMLLRFILLYVVVVRSITLFLGLQGLGAVFAYDIFAYLTFICLLCIVYLMSVESDPPSESKIRKLSKRIRSFIVSEPAGLPA